MSKRLLVSLLLLSLFSVASAMGKTDFVVKKIEVFGLQRIKHDTLYSYLPIKVGQTLDTSQSDKIINDLYHSSFFSDIRLARQGNTLIITVVERPIISGLNIKGNHAIKTKALKAALKNAGVTNGLEYNPSTIDDIENVLLQQYATQGKYNAQVNVTVMPLPRNRVTINIDIVEGSVAKIKQVSVVGNHAFSEEELRQQFKLSPPSILSIFTHNDIYSSEKLYADLDSLRNFYLDHGYIHYTLNSSQVSTTPDRTQIYITANISEGAQYRVSTVTYSGKTILSSQQLIKLTSLQKGDILSRQQIIDTQRAIKIALNNQGYARANIQVRSNIDEKNKTVALTLIINQGSKIYVRHVTFSNNYRTNDEALRRLIPQLEGALSSAKEINKAKRRLLQQPYIREVNETTTVVPGYQNEEDINYQLKESPGATFTAGAGYSSDFGPTFQLSLSQKNFLGTGNSSSINFVRNTYQTQYSISYYNPYHTQSGLGRGFSVYYDKYNGDNADISDYVTNSYGFAVNYNIPISDYTAYQLGYGYENTLLDIGSDPSEQTENFVSEYGRHFYQVKLNLGWSYRNFNRAIMPTQGLEQTLSATISAPLAQQSLKYYKTQYSSIYFKPIYQQSWLLKLNGGLGYAEGYGNYSDNYPFFENFYAGGMGSVRGYVSNSLGPRDSNDDALGGNMLLRGSVALVFPNPISHNVRSSWFVDGGNVFNSSAGMGNALGISGLAFNELRYSTGLEIDWLSPLGVTLNFAIAKALNSKPGDNTQFFGFTMSAGI